MIDEEYSALKDRIEALFDYWQARMGLKWWRIYRHYVRDASEFRVDEERRPDTAACCHADWRYLDADVKFNMLRCRDLDDQELEYAVVHELSHILVNETRGPELKAYLGHEERVATTVAKAFIWTRDMTIADEGVRRETTELAGHQP